MNDSRRSLAVTLRLYRVLNDSRRSLAVTLRLYRVLARAFPQEFKNAYGDELVQAGEDAIEPTWRHRGLFGLLRLLVDTAIRVPTEYVAELRQDFRYGLRMLARSPGFTAVALISLSLAVCIATCALCEMNGMVLRTVPAIAAPEQLVALRAPASFPNYKRYREKGDVFSSTAAYLAPVPVALAGDGHTERVWSHLITSSYFPTLGVTPLMGRVFTPAEDEPGHALTVIVSYRFWQEHLGGDNAVIGKSLRLNGHPATVIGVGPEDFLGASPLFLAADLWIPIPAAIGMAPELTKHDLERPDRRVFQVIGRLRPGVSVGTAEAALDATARQIESESGRPRARDKSRRVTLVQGGKLLPMRKEDAPFFTSFFLIMAGLVMLIACANVANMVLARATSRRREIAVRLALGASRARIIRQLLTESLTMALGAGVLGFLTSWWLMHLGAEERLPFPIPVRYDFQPDVRVVLFVIALTVFTGVAFGLGPALRATRTDIAPALKEGGTVLLRKYRRLSLRDVLMVVQLAGSLTLLVILGILALGIQTTIGIQKGFNPQNLYLMSIDPIRDGLSGEEAAVLLPKSLLRVRALPGVISATLTDTTPVRMNSAPWVKLFAADATPGKVRVQGALKQVVGKDYFETAGIPILLGRAFRQEDEINASAVIVSATLVHNLWKDQNPVGRRLEIEGGEAGGNVGGWPGDFDFRTGVLGKGRQAFEVVGVGGDVANSLVAHKEEAAIYFPLRPADYAQPSVQGVTLMVRALPGADVFRSVQRELEQMDTRITPFNTRTMTEQIDGFMVLPRAVAWIYVVIGAFGLVLASVGLAGVTAYSVVRRRHEIGIRMALGARAANVLALVMNQALVLVAIGTALGLAGAWAASRMLAAMNASVGTVTSTGTSDPVVFGGAPVLLAAIALIASFLPARKSTRIDPAIALRQE